jgi:HD-GYP domain-containing protein (c-di-GMP phosphodiesterase class II)
VAESTRNGDAALARPTPARDTPFRAHTPARPLLILPVGRALEVPPAVLDGLDIEHRDGWPDSASLDATRPIVCAIDESRFREVPGGLIGVESLAAVSAIVVLGSGDEPSAEVPAEYCSAFIPAGASGALVRAALMAALRQAATLRAARSAAESERARHDELTDLSQVAAALTTERDLESLLRMILSQARRLASADAGSLYLVERPSDDRPADTLRFKLAQNDTLPDLPLSEFTVPIDDKSVAGYVALTGAPIVIQDVYQLPSSAVYTFNRSFDEQFGYRTKSMLVIPMRTHRDETVGVLQLINRKRTPSATLADADAVEEHVTTFGSRIIDLVAALASQAAVAVENARLYEDIERLFEGFVTASVKAIEQRDPTTSGHSGRVAVLTTGLADAITRGGAPGPYRGLTFSRAELRELRYAALLHDFGKVGVRELVLVKQKKLYPWDLQLIRHRFAYLNALADAEFERERADYLLEHGPGAYRDAVGRLESRRDARRHELNGFLEAILRANEPTVLAEGNFDALSQINQRTYTDFEGVERPLLGDEELRFLMIRRGNLDDTERREIESHVTHSYRFLEQIPWTRELKGIPLIAFGHHEKLNGSGYPRAAKAEEIPVQTRMMTIADIYDALTATDRPYKRAVPASRALDILHDEAKAGMIDAHLLAVFTESYVWQRVLDVNAVR